MPRRVIDQEQFVDMLAMIEYVQQYNPEGWRWDQDSWAFQNECGTAFCAAGWVAHINKAEILFRCDSAVSVRLETATGRRYKMFISDYAERKLGISASTPHGLFSASNTLRDLYMDSAELTGMPEFELRRLVKERMEDVIPATMTLKDRVRD